MTEELWQLVNSSELVVGSKKKQKSTNHELLTTNLSVHLQPWPTYNPKLIQVEEVVIPVQVDGKLRDIIKVQSAKLKVKSYVEQLARKSIKAGRYIAENKVKRVVFVPGKLINFVTK